MNTNKRQSEVDGRTKAEVFGPFQAPAIGRFYTIGLVDRTPNYTFLMTFAVVAVEGGMVQLRRVNQWKNTLDKSGRFNRSIPVEKFVAKLADGGYKEAHFRGAIAGL